MRRRHTALALSTLLLASPLAADDTLPVRFTDVAEAAGLTFVHGYGIRPPRLLVQTLSGGGGWLDYNNDGRLDIYLVNGSPLTADCDPTKLRNALYRQNADGTFTEVTAEAGVGHTGYGYGCGFADYDDDGDVDIFVANFGPNVLYRNNGDGTFTVVTADAGVAGPPENWSTSVVWLDIDGDGRLDLYVANYLQYTPHHGIPCLRDGVHTPCPPSSFAGQTDQLLYNNGDGTFTDHAQPRGVAKAAGKGLGVVSTDYDADGDLDIYVANDQTQNLLFRNNGAGVFEEVALFSGVGFNEDGVAESGMGIALGDVEGDGDVDFVVTNFQHETNTLYANAGHSLFIDQTFQAGLGASSLLFLGFGTGLTDVDSDGDLDLFVANGHIEPHSERLETTSKYAQTNQLWLNDGAGQFRDVSAAAGPAFATARVSRAAAFADYDNDGDVDILVVNNGARVALYRNEGGNTAGAWFGLDIRIAGTDRPALGARVTVTVGERTLMREVRRGGSYLAQHDPRVLIGLGDQAQPDRVTVRTLAGDVVEVPDVTMGAYVRVNVPR